VADSTPTDIATPGVRPVERYAPPVLLALLVGAMVALMYATHRAGHWWGDDWALYVRQAEGLLHGHPNRVLTENEFTVTMSDGSEFSPPLYPWGFPLMLTPFVAVLGANLDRLTIVPVLCSVVFACCWYSLARPRIGWVAALIAIPAVTLSPLLLSWTELIQSEWPFLAVVGVALVCLDRAAASGVFVDERGRVAPLIVVGLAAAAAFTVRREGLAMIGAVGVAQLAALIDMRPHPWMLRGHNLWRLLARLALPLATFVAAVGLLQVLLPSTVVPKYDGTSVANVWDLRGRLVRNLAQVSGLQRPWDTDPMVLGSSRLGWTALILLLLLGVAGIVLALVRYRTRDLHLAAYAVGAYLIGGSFRSPINRYVATVGPVLMLLALIAVREMLGRARIGRLRAPHVATVVIAVLVSMITFGNLANAKLRVEGANRAREAGAIEWGPTHPDAIAMFDAVQRLTDEDDVVAAPKARAMVLETGRASIQVDDYRPIPPDVEIALLVVERGTRLAAAMGTNTGFTPVWENQRFVLYSPGG